MLTVSDIKSAQSSIQTVLNKTQLSKHLKPRRVPLG